MTLPGAPVLFGNFIDFQAKRSPESPAVIFGDLRWSYGDLNDHVDACARALLASGVSKGDRVAILSSPRPEFLVLFLGAARIGAISVGLNPVQQLDEYRHIIRDARPSMLFAFANLRQRENTEITKALEEEFLWIQQTIILDNAYAPGSQFDRFLSRARDVSETDFARRTEALTESDATLIVYTSGTTGKPKGAILTQGNITHCSRLYCRLWPLDPLRVISNLPITHVACCVETVAYALAAGGTIIFQEQFDAAEYLAAIEREGVSWTPLVPTMFQRILSLSDWQRYNTRSLKVILFGGAAMPADMICLLKRLSEGVVGCWGMTETTSGVTFTNDTDDIQVLAHSVGRAAPTIEVAIMGDEGRVLGAEEPGEVVVRGPCIFQGYFGMPAATRQVIDAEGWLHSGDLGRTDSEGRIYIVGRIKEMFKSGGYNVYPREIEIVLEAHPNISMAVVVSAPDPTYQEVGYAYILSEPSRTLTSEAVIRHCRERLANYKIPKRVFVRDSLPMLATGKIDRAALAKEAAAAASGPVQAAS